MTEHMILVATRADEMQRYIEGWQQDGWVLHSFHPPVAQFGPGSKWYATMTRDMLRLQWELSHDADVAGYRLYWSLTGEPWHVVATLPKWKTAWTTSANLLRGHIYTFAITTYDLAGNESEKRIIAQVDRR